MWSGHVRCPEVPTSETNASFLCPRFIPKTGLVLSLVGGFAALTISACLLRTSIGPLVTARFDAPIIQFAAAHRVAGLTSVMKALTTAGNPLYLSITVLVGGAVLAWLTRSWRPLMVLALVMFGAVSLDYLVKLAVRIAGSLSRWSGFEVLKVLSASTSC